MHVNYGWLLLGILAFGPSACVGQLTDGASVDRLPTIASGTVIGDPTAERWNRVVLLAKPRIASGDVGKLSESVRESVGQFSLSIVATVRDISVNGAAGTKFRLAEVGVAYSIPINGKLTVVTADTASKLGVTLGFVGSQMLSENEKQLSTIKLVVRSETLVMFDKLCAVVNQNHLG